MESHKEMATLNELYDTQVLNTEAAYVKIDKLVLEIQRLSGIKKDETGFQTEQTGDVIEDYKA